MSKWRSHFSKCVFFLFFVCAEKLQDDFWVKLQCFVFLSSLLCRSNQWLAKRKENILKTNRIWTPPQFPVCFVLTLLLFSRRTVRNDRVLVDALLHSTCSSPTLKWLLTIIQPCVMLIVTCTNTMLLEFKLLLHAPARQLMSQSNSRLPNHGNAFLPGVTFTSREINVSGNVCASFLCSGTH